MNEYQPLNNLAVLTELRMTASDIFWRQQNELLVFKYCGLALNKLELPYWYFSLMFSIQTRRIFM